MVPIIAGYTMCFAQALAVLPSLLGIPPRAANSPQGGPGTNLAVATDTISWPLPGFATQVAFWASEPSRSTTSDYHIERLDVVPIRAGRLVPPDSSQIRTFDLLQVDVRGAPADRPVNGIFLVDAGGRVDLGQRYGRVRVAGMSVGEAAGAIDSHLHQVLRMPETSVKKQASRLSTIR